MNAYKWWLEQHESKPIDWKHVGRVAWFLLENTARIMNGEQVGPPPGTQRPPSPPPDVSFVMTPEQAAVLLGVTVEASPDQVRAALRAKMSTGNVHPDHGGDAEVAKKLVAAKNLLVGRARRAP